MEYCMYLAIGDYEKEKHGQYRKYLFKSNKPVEDVRKVHFSIEQKFGICMEGLCSKEFEDTVNDESYQKIKDLGFDVDTFFREIRGRYVIGPNGLAHLWAFLLQKADPELVMLTEADAEFPFVNTEDPAAKIGPVGNGLFY